MPSRGKELPQGFGGEPVGAWTGASFPWSARGSSPFLACKCNRGCVIPPKPTPRGATAQGSSQNHSGLLFTPSAVLPPSPPRVPVRRGALRGRGRQSDWGQLFSCVLGQGFLLPPPAPAQWSPRHVPSLGSR